MSSVFRLSALLPAALGTLLLGCGGGSTDEPVAAPAFSSGFAIIAHRGGAAYAPENTLLAFQNAVRLGVDQIEADLQTTRDGELVVFHDDRLERTTDCSGAVAEHTLAELGRCDAAYWFVPGQPVTQPAPARLQPLRGQGIGIPTLQELLDYVRSLRGAGPVFALELKARSATQALAAADQLLQLLRGSGLEAQLQVASFWPQALERVKQQAPQLQVSLLRTSQLGHGFLDSLQLALTGQFETLGFDLGAADVTPDAIAAAQHERRQVVLYTADSRMAVASVQQLQPDGVVTNFPVCYYPLTGRQRPDRILPPALPGPDLAACLGEDGG